MAKIIMFRKSKSKSIDFTRTLKNVEKVVEKLPYIRKRKKKSKYLSILKYILFVFLLLLFTFLVIFLFNLKNIKLVYNESQLAKRSIELAAIELKNKNYSQAEKSSLEAKKSLTIVEEKIEHYRTKKIFIIVPYFKSQLNDSLYLIKTASKLCDVAIKASQFGVKLNDTINNPNRKFSSLTQEEKGDILSFIHENSISLEHIEKELALALKYLDRVEFSGVLRFIATKVSLYNDLLTDAHVFIAKAIPLSKMIPVLLGHPEKSTFLMVLQNNDELRPSGGFIGTYGILQVLNSDIIIAETHDIYHMDMPVKDLISEIPPEPIQKYLKMEKWFMRDANWSPNWPTSAERIEWFFYKENSLLPEKNKINSYEGEFDGVIAITPGVVSDLLTITGPITVGDVTYNTDNFHDILQYEVERGFEKKGVPSWERKEVIAEILKELKIRLLDLGPKNLYEGVGIVSDQIDRKNILFYLKDKEVQEIVKKERWAGEVEQISVGQDYFLVVDSNMGSFKTDHIIDRSVNYQITEEIDGLYSELRVNYSHGGDFDWRTTTYRDYVRVYVPQGSELIKAGGFNNSEEIKIYDELGKTVFAVFLTIDPGEIGNINFKYKLPNTVKESLDKGSYSLLAQKQPGNDINEFNFEADFFEIIKSYKPTGFNVGRPAKNKIDWSSDLLGDKYFEIGF